MTTRNRELASIIDDSGNITAGGNLTVSGTTLTASSTVETHADPLIELNTGAGSNSNDLGFVFERGSTGDNACILWDESNDGFAVGTTTATGTSTGNMSFTTADFAAGKVTVDNVLINGTTIGHTSDTDLLTLADGLLTVAGEISVTTLDIGGTNVTSTAAELNILDGVNSTAAELNILDGVTSTATELNIMDGDTSASSTTLADADRVVVNDGGTMKQVALTDFETYFESSIDTFSTIDINGGSIDGATVGANSASSGAFTTLSASGAITGTLGTAAQSNITSLGTLTTLTVDNVIINGTTIGHTSDTDLLTLADGALSVAGTLGVGTSSIHTGAKAVFVDGAGTLPTMAAGDVLTIQNNDGTSDNAGFTVIAGTAGISYINFGDSGDKNIGGINYHHSDNSYRVYANATEKMRITSAGDIGIGCTPSAGTRLEIRDSANSAIMELLGTDGRGLKLFTRKSNYPTDSGQNDAAVVYDAQDTEASSIYGQHIFQTGGTTRMQVNSLGVDVATSARITQTALTSSSAAVAWDAKAAANAYHLTTENTTFSAPSNAVEGAIISVEIAQGGTARTIAWNTVFEFAASTAPTITATANKTDILSFRYNGSVWQEVGRVQNMAQT